MVSQILTGRSFFQVPRGGRNRSGTLPCSLISRDTLGQSGGVLRSLGTNRPLPNTQTEPCSGGCGVARTRSGTRGAQGLRPTDVASRLLHVGRGTGRFTSALRKLSYGESLSGYSLQVGPQSSREEAIAASTPNRQPRLIVQSGPAKCLG